MIAYDFLKPEEITLHNEVFDINLLLTQLSASAQPITYAGLAEVARNAHLLVARATDADESKKIVGMATLCILHKPTGTTGIIEDVIVDDWFRGQHIGETLVLVLIKKATELPIKSLELTSKPERIAANKLYQKLGFEIRNTNHYVLSL